MYAQSHAVRWTQVTQEYNEEESLGFLMGLKQGCRDPF